MAKREIIIERLIEVAALVVIALVLYGTWLLWPDKVLILLLGFLHIFIFSLLMEAADSQKKEHREERRCATKEYLCVMPN